MQTAAPPVPTPKRSKRRWFFVGGFVLCLLLTPFIYALIVNAWSDYELEQICREMDAEDPNWRWVDLVRQLPPVPPDERNAILQLQKVIRLNKATPFALPFGRKMPLPKNARLGIADEQRLRAALAALAPKVLEEARKLKDMPEGGVTIDPEVAVMDVKWEPEPLFISQMTSILEHDAMLQAQNGKLEEAAEICLAITHSAHAIGDSPTLMAQVVRTAIAVRAAGAIERTLAQGILEDESLEPLQKALTTEANHDGTLQALRGHRAFLQEYYLGVRHGNISVDTLLSDWQIDRSLHGQLYRYFPGALLRTYAESLRFNNEIVRAAKLEEKAQREAFHKMEEKPDAGMPWIRISIAHVIKGRVEDCARLRCAVAALAAERFCLNHKHWPAGIGELVKEGLLKEPIGDPFDGQPLRFQRTDTGLIVYSVGADKFDNQGEKGDIRFELWHRQLRAIEPPVVKGK